MVRKRELKNFLSLLRAKGEGKNKYGTIPQNFNRSTNGAMEHNGSGISDARNLETLNY